MKFTFGKNWKRFVPLINDQRVEFAKQSLTEFTGLKDFTGMSVIDIGCGSGLYSYSAYLLNAKRLVSVDLDPGCVECANTLRQQCGNPANWEARQGSILDDKFVSGLGKYDLVYSWGVLHHTGQMWKAIENAAKLVADNGLFYIAIYNKVGGRRGSALWVKIKKLYNKVPFPIRILMHVFYIIYHFVSNIILLHNPLKDFMSDYRTKEKRGQNWLIDITDWLGAYPYEFANIEEIFRFMKVRFPSFVLENLKQDPGLGNNWFLFRNFRNEPDKRIPNPA